MTIRYTPKTWPTTRKTAIRRAICTCTVLLLVALCTAACTALDTSEGALPGARHIDIKTANNPAGFYIKFDGGGLNALHITSSPLEMYGQVTTSTDQAGTFYVSDTGGRGFFDDLILMVAVNGEVPEDIRVNVRSSGYRWAAMGMLNEPPGSEDITYVSGAVNATFENDHFIYGPQSWKPAGMNAPMEYPIFYGQDVTDSATQAMIMFIDLKVGAIGPNTGLDGLTDNGMAKVEYSIEGLDTYATFNVYGWCNQSNQGNGISWTNAVSGDGSSGYMVLGIPYASHKSDFAVQEGGALPHENQKNPISATSATTAATTPKSPAGAFACIAALGALAILGKR